MLGLSPKALSPLALLVGCAGALLGTSPVLAQPGKTPPAAASKAGATKDWWRDAVWYTIDIRSFADRSVGKSSQDGNGEFLGAADHVSYLNDGDAAKGGDLGVKGVRIVMPLQADKAQRGVMDYYSTDLTLGSAEDLKTLISECHSRGVRVVIDLPVASTSAEHPWFKEASSANSPMRSWYVWSGAMPAGGEKSWFKAEDGSAYYLATGGKDFPRLNIANPEVTASLVEAAKFWLIDQEADGVCLVGAGEVAAGQNGAHADGAAGQKWLADLTGAIKRARSTAVVFAEGFSASDAAKTPAAAADAVLSHETVRTIAESIRSGDAAAIIAAAQPGAGATPMVAMGSPEAGRVASILGGDAALQKVAATVYLTLPGVSSVYYGEELGMGAKSSTPRAIMQWKDSENAGFGPAKPWQEIGSDVKTVNVESQAKDEHSVLATCKRLVKLRQESAALSRGQFTPVVADHASVLAYLRHQGEDVYMVIANLGEQPLTEYALTLTTSPLRGTMDVADVTGSKGLSAVLSPEGGFSDYRPLDRIEGRTAYVLKLSAKK